jgi:hypothetical protein
MAKKRKAAKTTGKATKRSVTVTDLAPKETGRAGIPRRRVVNVRANAAAGATRTASGKGKKAKSAKPKVAKKKAVAVKNLAAPDAGKTKRATALGIRRLV